MAGAAPSKEQVCLLKLQMTFFCGCDKRPGKEPVKVERVYFSLRDSPSQWGRYGSRYFRQPVELHLQSVKKQSERGACTELT